MDINDNLKILEKLKASMKLEPYIKYIRFPYFKNLEEGLKIDFDFPITALVGQNGTNKSSILRAIYGCPEDNNIGNFWFSTDVDPILEQEQRNRFIYCYYQPQAKRDVEALKSRIQRTTKRKGKPPRINPDYWEPSRPLIGDGMEKMPEDGDLAGRTKTRWDLIKKEVVFLDFRSEISAYDKYFYHGDLRRTLRHHTKQDFIRSRSSFIKEAIENNLNSKKMYRGFKEHIFENEVLKEEEVGFISEILGRNYSSIRIIKHKFFGSIGESVLLSSSEINYSEAFAGSGEYAVVLLVRKIMSAPPNSLIILDEPEVSLHPGAQEKLVLFLFQRVKLSKHQIVLGTHSPYITKNLPSKAVKTLYFDPISCKIKALNETSSEEAFFHLGTTSGKKYTIFVEDRLAGEIVKKALRLLGEALFKQIEIKFMPGGAGPLLLNYLPSYALTGREDALFLADGDQRPEKSIEKHCDFNFFSDDELSDTLFDRLKGELKIPLDGGDGELRVDQLRESRVKILRYTDSYLNYLPESTPEDFIWNNIDLTQVDHDFSQYEYTKEKFVALSRWELGKEQYEELESDEIFNIQKRYLAKLDDSLFSELAEIFQKFTE